MTRFDRTALFVQALRRLEDACARPRDEFIRDAVIQRFESTFELAWKTLKEALRREGIEAASPRSVIREAVTLGWLTAPDAWTQMLQMRNLTTHTYDEALAERVYDFICQEGVALFAALAERLRSARHD